MASPREIFVFEQPFWINLHHFLYVLGRAENRAPDRIRRAVANAPKDQDFGLMRMPADDQATWRAAVTEYAGTWSKKDPIFDSGLASFTAKLVRPAGADTEGALQRVEAIYRKTWWPAHTRANDIRIRALRQMVDDDGQRVLAFITRIYREPWPSSGYPVNVAGYSNWAGAYSTNNRLLVVSSLDNDQSGLAGFETVFHEAMHQWDDSIDAKLKAAGERAHKKIPDALSHAMIFYTAGYAVHSIAPGYTPYADAQGVWQRGWTDLKAVLDVAWKPYLDGTGKLDAALDAVVRQLQ